MEIFSQSSPSPCPSSAFRSALQSPSSQHSSDPPNPSSIQYSNTPLPISLIPNPSSGRSSNTHLPPLSPFSDPPLFPSLPFSSGHSDEPVQECGGGGRFLGSLSPSGRARTCDVYIGFCGLRPSSSTRFAKWLRAELEMQGVSCFLSNRRRCANARDWRLVRTAIKEASLGVVVVERRSFSNPRSIEEIRFFSRKRNLFPIFFQLGQGECIARDIIEKRGDLWERHGGKLWTEFDGVEEEWREAVDGLSRPELKLEADASNFRDCVSDAVALLGMKLGKREAVESVKRWKELAEEEEFPFPRNVGFLGRQRELLELELILFGEVDGAKEDECVEIRTNQRHRRIGSSRSSTESEQILGRRSHHRKIKRKKGTVWKEPKEDIEMQGVGGGEKPHYSAARGELPPRHGRMKRSIDITYGRSMACVSGDSGIGKTELLLEFAYRFSQRYKMVLWVGGEARYVRQNYLNLLPLLGVDVSTENELCLERDGPGRLEDMEEEAIRRVRKELMRDIPYLLIVDNLESEKDWWDGRNVTELLPCFGGATDIIISTRLCQIMNIKPLRLSYLSGGEAMSLMKGSPRDLPAEEVDALRVIEEKLGGLPLGLAVVGAILSELPINPPKLLDTINRMPYRELTWSDREDSVLKHNSFLVQLFDVCFSIFDHAEIPKKLATGMIQASGWFAPSSIPIRMLARAAEEAPEERDGTQFCLKHLRRVACGFMTSHAETSEAEATDMLLRFQIARRSNKVGQICFHGIVKRYARKRGGAGFARAAVRAISTEASLPQHSEHIWAAGFLLFKFGTEPAVVNLTLPHMLSFIRKFVLPLASHNFTTFSRCKAILEFLRLSTEALETAEDSFLSEAENTANRCLCASTSRYSVEFNPSHYRELALLRAALLETRAKLMLRGGVYEIGEQLCRTAVNIKEVIYGEEHPETIASRETMERLRRLQSKF